MLYVNTMTSHSVCYSYSYMGKNYFRNFLVPNPGICEVPGENHPGKSIFESDHIYPVLNDLEVSRNVI